MKTKPMQDLCDHFSLQIFGIARTDALQQQICVICKEPALTFKDSLSAKEYNISGLCQACQDATFTDGE